METETRQPGTEMVTDDEGVYLDTEQLAHTRFSLTGAELLELVHWWAGAMGLTDGLGGAEWARRIDEHGGPAQYRSRALTELEHAIEDAVNESPKSSPDALADTWERRYGPDGHGTSKSLVARFAQGVHAAR